MRSPIRNLQPEIHGTAARTECDGAPQGFDGFFQDTIPAGNQIGNSRFNLLIGFDANAFDATAKRGPVIRIADIQLASVGQFDRSADAQQTATRRWIRPDNQGAFSLLHCCRKDFRATG